MILKVTSIFGFPLHMPFYRIIQWIKSWKTKNDIDVEMRGDLNKNSAQASQNPKTSLILWNKNVSLNQQNPIPTVLLNTYFSD